MNVRHVAIGALVVALLAWALYMALTVAAYAHTLPMSEVRRGILDAVDDNFKASRVNIVLQSCRRIDAHGGECVVRVFYKASPDLPQFCGVGWAKLIGKSDYMRAHGSLHACPRRAGRQLGGNPITS
jgi:hypothetical protein